MDAVCDNLKKIVNHDYYFGAPRAAVYFHTSFVVTRAFNGVHSDIRFMVNDSDIHNRS